MQFGKTQGIALIILGIILIGVQFKLGSGSPGNVPPRGQPSAVTEPPRDVHRLGPLAAIIGTVSLVAGIAVFATSRRRDQPDSNRQVR
jgi:hypothetical protein